MPLTGIHGIQVKFSVQLLNVTIPVGVAALYFERVRAAVKRCSCWQNDACTRYVRVFVKHGFTAFACNSDVCIVHHYR